MLDDKYRIERLIAVGGMGAVYLGTHIKLRKRVAIKVLNPQLSSAPMVERFHREAITASQIGHEGIAQVTDLGTSSDGEPFLVMEYLEGESLASRLRTSGPLAIEDACELGCAILSPLAAAHHAGIIHRDLKPDNVFLVRQSRGEMVKLLDFGISRTAGLESEFRLTTTGLVLGTPYYMSPEQARGDSEVTPAADLYAFGVILYEMLVGNVPIQAENYNQLMYRVMIGDYARPRERRPDLPDALEQIILHSMALAPYDRPASAIDLEHALLAFCRPVFREHASGRTSAPGLPLKTPAPANAYGTGPGRDGTGPGRDGAGIDHTVVAGSHAAARSAGEARARPGEPIAGPGGPWHRDNPSGTSPSGSGVRDGEAGAVPQGAWRRDNDLAPTLDKLSDDAQAAATQRDRPRALASSRRSRLPWILGGLGLLAAIAGVVAAVGSNRGDTPVATAPPVPAPIAITHTAGEPAIVVPPAPPPVVRDGSAAALAAPPPAAPPATTVTLRFAVEPAGGTITLDGKEVTGASVVVPKDDAVHRLRITAPGYLGHDESVRFDENQRLVVQLKAASGPVRAKAPRKERPGTERIDSKSPYD